MRRLAAEPGENGPPCRELETSKNLDPRTALGFAAFTLLKTLRTFRPKVRLYRRSELDDIVIGPPPPNSGPPTMPAPTAATGTTRSRHRAAGGLGSRAQPDGLGQPQVH